jgi:hypothetical protein
MKLLSKYGFQMKRQPEAAFSSRNKWHKNYLTSVIFFDAWYSPALIR